MLLHQERGREATSRRFSRHSGGNWHATKAGKVILPGEMKGNNGTINQSWLLDGREKPHEQLNDTNVVAVTHWKLIKRT